MLIHVSVCLCVCLLQYNIEEEKALMLLERINDAQRSAAVELKESTVKKKRKRSEAEENS